MRWRRMRDTPDVIDQRAAGGGRLPFPGGARVGGGVGLVGIARVPRDPAARRRRWSGIRRRQPVRRPGARLPAAAAIPADQDPERDLRDFSAYVFTRAQRTWERTFARAGPAVRAREARAVSRRRLDGMRKRLVGGRAVLLPCRPARLSGPRLLRDMASQLGAQGDFAWAYVIAHELGHHVQRQLGTSEEVRRLGSQDPRAGQRAVGPSGAAGRLLLGCVGLLGVHRRRPPEGRRRGGHHRRRGRRR